MQTWCVKFVLLGFLCLDWEPKDAILKMPRYLSHWNGNVMDTSRIDREVSIPISVPFRTWILLSLDVLRHKKSWSRVSNSTSVPSGFNASLLKSLQVNHPPMPGIGVLLSGMLLIARVFAFSVNDFANAESSGRVAPQAGMLTSFLTISSNCLTISSNFFRKSGSETSLEPVTSGGVVSSTMCLYAQHRALLSLTLGSPLTSSHRFAKVRICSQTEELIPIDWACKEIGDAEGKFSSQFLMTTVSKYHLANI